LLVFDIVTKDTNSSNFIVKLISDVIAVTKNLNTVVCSTMIKTYSTTKTHTTRTSKTSIVIAVTNTRVKKRWLNVSFVKIGFILDV